MPAKRNRDDDDTKKGKQEWFALVDAIDAQTAQDGGDPFPLDKDWDPEDYLPSGHPITDSMKRHIEKNKLELGTQSIYRRRMTEKEMFQAKPKAPKETDVFLRKDDGKVLPELGSHEGPDFTQISNKGQVKEMEKKLVALRNKGGKEAAAAIKKEIGQQSGIIGTAMTTARNQLTSGLVRKKCDFIPTIIVPDSFSAILSIWNIKEFLQNGTYVEPSSAFLNPEDGTARLRDKETSVTVTPGSVLPGIDNFGVKFRTFRVVDSPDEVQNWDQVCACFVTGQNWQLEKWYDGDKRRSDPATLFSQVKGFLPFFEEDKPPVAMQKWKVEALQLSRKQSKAFTHIHVAKKFWEEVFKFMETHPAFRQYTIPADSVLGGASLSQLGATNGSYY